MRRFLFFFILLFTFLLLAKTTHAQDFKDDYNVKYNVRQNGSTIDTLVNFTVNITNLKSDLFVKRFSLTFPRGFVISGLSASDDSGPITPEVAGDGQNSKISLEFTNPHTGRGSENSFHLNFHQTNLFKVNGNVWEVILPTIEGNRTGDYQVEVQLPDATKKISIAKPKPTSISGNIIAWTNPTTRTIYAVFGDTQLYSMKLAYNLENPKFYKVYTDIAFPPDMSHQKNYITSINPPPSMTYTDQDGNYYGRYYLSAKSKEVVTYAGTSELSVRPRDEIVEMDRNKIDLQKKYLLNQAQYWTIPEKELSKYEHLKTSQDIYSYITNTFHYDYQRISKNIDRLGAATALANPTKAVCVEFSDSFVALAREKGIFSREIEGYGFSQDDQLRPLSLLADVLHSWPEFYDNQAQMWQSVDPTWQNTSGIDYFSSFDLDHIAFAIHGAKDDYPYPAGMYKIADSHDVSIFPTAQAPTETVSYKTSLDEVPKTIDNQKTYQIKINVKNTGNIFTYNIPVIINSTDLSVTPQKLNIASLAPYETKTLTFDLHAGTVARQEIGSLEVVVDGNTLGQQDVRIIPYYYTLAAKLSILLLSICAVLLIAMRLKKRRTDYEEN